jgi:hypothetical protein
VEIANNGQYNAFLRDSLGQLSPPELELFVAELLAETDRLLAEKLVRADGGEFVPALTKNLAEAYPSTYTPETVHAFVKNLWSFCFSAGWETVIYHKPNSKKDDRSAGASEMSQQFRSLVIALLDRKDT